ncbi:MAG TPA: type I restriction enzyme HsdR N-terminal domain-containing protein [Salinivirgaceae bacterium]|nr:type I restriction enzyme HsdR N-terminal domain-containing protein [Salinivirgaceae bacterium]
MQELIFPPINPKIKTEDNRQYILDPVRKAWVALTPEEWVRQHVIDFLINYRNYPLALMKTEAAHKSSVGIRRTDIIVCDKVGKPAMIVECKAPDVKITQETLEQIANYNLTVKAEYLLVTNGLVLFGYKINFDTGKISSLSEIPNYDDLL